MMIPDAERSQAVLIGVSQYGDGELGDRPAVGRSAERLAELLSDESVWGIPKSNITVLTGERATLEACKKAVDTAADRASACLLVYFSGHARKQPTHRASHLYLAPYDSPGHSPIDWWPYGNLHERMGARLVNAPDSRVLILDCCYAGHASTYGPLSEDAADDITVGDLSAVLMAVAGSQKAWAPDANHDPYTLYSGKLIRLLDHGIPSGPETLTLERVGEELTSLHIGEDRHPEHLFKGTSGKIALARNRAFDRSRSDLDGRSSGRVDGSPETDKLTFGGPRSPVGQTRTPRGQHRHRSRLVAVLAVAMTVALIGGAAIAAAEMGPWARGAAPAENDADITGVASSDLSGSPHSSPSSSAHPTEPPLAQEDDKPSDDESEEPEGETAETFSMFSETSNLCLESGPDRQLLAASCGRLYQTWEEVTVSDGVFIYKNVDSQLCLTWTTDIKEGSLSMSTCHIDNDSQHWSHPEGPTYYQTGPPDGEHIGGCLDHNRERKVYRLACNYGDFQSWERLDKDS